MTCEECEKYGRDYYMDENGVEHWRCARCPKSMTDVKPDIMDKFAAWAHTNKGVDFKPIIAEFREVNK